MTIIMIKNPGIRRSLESNTSTRAAGSEARIQPANRVACHEQDQYSSTLSMAAFPQQQQQQ